MFFKFYEKNLRIKEKLNTYSSATYNFLSIVEGIGLIVVPNSCSILYKLNLSSYVTKLIAIPK
jgi:hypothetical protein